MTKKKDKRPVLFISSSCKACGDVKAALKERRLNRDLDVIDIDTDEGFEVFNREVLEKQDGKIPSAFKDGKPCLLGFDEDKVFTIQCPTDSAPEPDPASQPVDAAPGK